MRPFSWSRGKKEECAQESRECDGFVDDFDEFVVDIFAEESVGEERNDSEDCDENKS